MNYSPEEQRIIKRFKKTLQKRDYEIGAWIQDFIIKEVRRARREGYIKGFMDCENAVFRHT